MTNPLDHLLERLSQGEDEAAAMAFRAYEPYLRMVVRRQLSAPLRAKFDSEDVVLSVWADLLEGFRSRRWQFPDAARLRAFLVRATRNRFLNRVRHHRPALDREVPLASGTWDELREGTASEPRPSENAQAEDLWQKMLRLCPPAHRELLVLKRQGLSLAELAVRTGLHKSSVRRILYNLARRLAAGDG